MNSEQFHPPVRVLAAVVLTIAAVYFHFLIFTQYALLHLIQAAAGNGTQPPRMAILAAGAAGVAGSLFAAWRYTVARGPAQLAGALALCAIAAGGSLLGKNPRWLPGVAALSGLGAGVATVTLAAMLRRAAGRERLGLVIGLGTGLAYGAANLPPVFAAEAPFQAVLAMLAACVGLVTGRLFELRGPGEKPVVTDYAPGGAALWILILLGLVGLDSMAFYVIQHTPALKENTWTGAPRLFANAGVHFLAAVLAGAALDRRWVGRTTLLAAGLLITACLLIDGGSGWAPIGGLMYAAAVSLYSTVLVFYPARGARPWLAALIFAVAGWGGSALGLGLAQGRGQVPGWLLAATGILVGGALWVRRRRLESKAQSSQPPF